MEQTHNEAVPDAWSEVELSLELIGQRHSLAAACALLAAELGIALLIIMLVGGA